MSNVTVDMNHHFRPGIEDMETPSAWSAIVTAKQASIHKDTVTRVAPPPDTMLATDRKVHTITVLPSLRPCVCSTNPELVKNAAATSPRGANSFDTFDKRKPAKQILNQ